MFKNNTVFKTGLSGTITSTIDLTVKQLSEVNYYCGLICDRIQFCYSDLLTGIKACIDTGNMATTMDQTRKINNYCATGFYGNYVNIIPFDCVQNFGLIYFKN